MRGVPSDHDPDGRVRPVSRTARRGLIVESDGGSRGNPGVAGYGAVVREAPSGRVLVELAEPLGTTTNNVAEYRGLLAGLKAAFDIDPGADVSVRMDSDLIVKQMTGVNKVKHPNMRPLALEAQAICTAIRDNGGNVDFTWIPRELNQTADALSNAAMDGKTIRRVHGEHDEASEPADAPDAPDDLTGRRDLRLVLVQAPSTERAVERVAAAVRPLVGPDSRVITSTEPLADQTGRAVAELIGTEVEVSADWAADPGRAGSELADAASSAAYGRLRLSGGTVVVVTTRRGIVTVLAEVLGLGPERFWSLATAPGSLSGVEAWADGTASIAFTNRTDHLA